MPIVWLASYPKSGNTWVRAFLANLLAGADEPVTVNSLPAFAYGEHHLKYYAAAKGGPVDPNDFTGISQLRARAQQILDASGKGVKFVKTHSAVRKVFGAPTINPAVTAAAIYILRNPLDVVLSYADHYGMTHDATIDALADEGWVINGDHEGVFQFLGPWSIHVRSWTEAKGLKCLALRYEDLHQTPIKSFRSLTKFLNINADRAAIEKAAGHASFKSLKSQEQQGGFIERSPHSQAFFRQGTSGGWRTVLSEAQVQRVIDSQGEVMARFGYLDKLGRPL